MALSDAKSAQVKTYLSAVLRLWLCASALCPHSVSSSSSGSILRYSLFAAVAGLAFTASIILSNTTLNKDYY